MQMDAQLAALCAALESLCVYPATEPATDLYQHSEVCWKGATALLTLRLWAERIHANSLRNHAKEASASGGASFLLLHR